VSVLVVAAPVVFGPTSVLPVFVLVVVVPACPAAGQLPVVWVSSPVLMAVESVVESAEPVPHYQL